MNTKIPVLVICIEAILIFFFQLHNLHTCTFRYLFIVLRRCHLESAFNRTSTELYLGPLLTSMIKLTLKSVRFWSFSGPHFPTFGPEKLRIWTLFAHCHFEN